MRGFSQSIKRKRCHSVALLLFLGGGVACGASSGIRVETSVRQSRGTRNCSPKQKKINEQLQILSWWNEGVADI